MVGGSVARKIRVAIRIRFDSDCSQQFEATNNTISFQQVNTNEPKRLTFDKVFGMDQGQQEVFDAVGVPTTTHVVDGYNGTILVYGQTGSGKTHTMLGPNGGTPSCLDEQSADFANRGLIPRIGTELYDRLSGIAGVYTVQGSFYEIYQEKVRDLLDPQDKSLQVLGDKSNVKIAGLSSQELKAAADLLRILRLGTKHRAKRATDSNEYSSRSHAILTLTITQKLRDGRELQSKLNLVDLAGSERLAKTGATGKAASEGASINLSLSALGQVIHQLCQSHEHISFRNSVLTRVLQDSLGGNSVTTMVCTVSPVGNNMPESVSTLVFANYAKEIKNHTKQNIVLSNKELQARLNAALEEIERLKRELEEKRKRDKSSVELAKSVMLTKSAAVGVGGSAYAPPSQSVGIGAEQSAFDSSRARGLLEEIEQRQSKEDELREALREAEERVNERDVEVARLKEEIEHWKSLYQTEQENNTTLNTKYDSERKMVIELRSANESLLSSLQHAKKLQASQESKANQTILEYTQKLSELNQQTQNMVTKDSQIQRLQDEITLLSSQQRNQAMSLQHELELQTQELQKCKLELQVAEQTVSDQHNTILTQSGFLDTTKRRGEHLERQIGELRTERDELQMEVLNARKEVARYQSDLESVQTKHTQSMTDVVMFRGKVTELEEQLQEVKEKSRQLESVQQSNVHLEKMLAALKGQTNNNDNVIEKLHTQIETSQKSFQEQMEKQSELERALGDEAMKVRDLHSRLQTIEGEYSQCTDRVTELEQSNQDLAEKNLHLTQQLKDTNALINNFKSLADDAQQDSSNMKRQLEDLSIQKAKELQALKREMSAASSIQVVELQSKLVQEQAKFQTDVSKLHQQISQFKHQMTEAREEVASLQGLADEKAQFEELLEQNEADKDSAEKKAECYRSALIVKDKEMGELKAALDKLAESVQQSNLSPEDKLKLLDIPLLKQQVDAFEALAKKLYDEAVQHDFCALVESDLQLRGEEQMEAQLGQIPLVHACQGGVSRDLDAELYSAVMAKHSLWSDMAVHLGRVQMYLNRTQFINPDDEGNRLNLITTARGLLATTAEMQLELKVASAINEQGDRVAAATVEWSHLEALKDIIMPNA